MKNLEIPVSGLSVSFYLNIFILFPLASPSNTIFCHIIFIRNEGDGDGQESVAEYEKMRPNMAFHAIGELSKYCELNFIICRTDNYALF